MKQDEIIEMAINAWKEAGEGWVDKNWFEDRAKALKAFAKLVAAKEREECAKVCDDIRHPWGYSAETSDWERGTEHCADAIRARGEAWE